MSTYYHESVKHVNHIPALIAILKGDDINKYFPTDIFIPAHWHRSLEISLLEDAKVVLQMGEKKQLIEDDFTCVNSGIVHSLYAQSIGKNPHAIIVLISYDFIKQYYPHIDEITFDLSINKDHQELKELYYRLEKLYLNQDEFSYLNIIACLLEILNLLLRKYQSQTINHNQQQIKSILSYLHDHYQEDLSLDHLSKQFHISKEYFSRQFHREIGKTFKDYLMSYRLYKAYNDVINSSKTIQDIAMIHGFSNTKSFIKIFRCTYHDTPLQYRKKMLRD